ncbi:putative lipoprotein [Mycobacterium xenopi 4042]|uniref:Putative lipoprotein n=1 Tax=Mycobacterium xenopi 4042 TaxID=1299334 RepID=X8AN99_MYCXE|nr:putative lipoprotein [Mycobacterium xenopi 4042]
MAGRSVTAARLRRSWLVAVVIPAVVMGLGACGGNSGSAPAKVIFDKGTPFSDLLVPKLTASVTDGAVGVGVDAPVTVSAEGGVLAQVTLVNENGKSVSGRLSPDGVRWSTTEPLGYNRSYTLTAKARGWAASLPAR